MSECCISLSHHCTTPHYTKLQNHLSAFLQTTMKFLLCFTLITVVILEVNKELCLPKLNGVEWNLHIKFDPLSFSQVSPPRLVHLSPTRSVLRVSWYYNFFFEFNSYNAFIVKTANSNLKFSVRSYTYTYTTIIQHASKSGHRFGSICQYILPGLSSSRERLF